MTIAVAETWAEAPLRRFVDEARVLLALLLYPSGQVLGQHGFTRAVDVMSACALAAGIHASAGELGRALDGRAFRELYHAGRTRRIYIAEVETPRGPFIFLAVFDDGSSLGLVQLYFQEFRAALATAAPQTPPPPRALGLDFERDLNRSLASLFGRAEPTGRTSGRSTPVS
jgi:hypothetical protein